MSDLVVRLSDTEEPPAFLDVQYVSDQDVGNSARTVLSLKDFGGASITLHVTQHNGKEREVIRVDGVDAVDVELHGSIERDDLLRAMRYILEAERVSDIIRWGGHSAV